METPPVTDLPPAPMPDLAQRGHRLWVELTAEGPKPRPAERALIEEICRSADRLDTLDGMLRGDEDSWVHLRPGSEDDGGQVQLVINNLLAEARQQQVAFKQLLGELRQARAAAASAPSRPNDRRKGGGSGAVGPEVVQGGGGVVNLAARIAAKRAAPAR
jgi:hypothetical protein